MLRCSPCVPRQPRCGILKALKVAHVDVVALEGVVERLDIAVCCGVLIHVLYLDAEDGHGFPELVARALGAVVVSMRWRNGRGRGNSSLVHWESLLRRMRIPVI